ncbi:MAG: DUF4956 domain-containing protein [Clostridia bacterium]|nr:DUF4956 domain-containing protein [Clostridia bacterium]
MMNSVFVQGNLTLGSVLICFAMAMLLGFAGAWHYMRSNTASRSFAFTLALLPLVTSAVIMVVNGNIGAGIAVAGSFSLIRFRSVQGSGQEILAVFLSAAVGLCIGAGYLVIACLLMGLCMLLRWLLSAIHFGELGENEREIRITIPENMSTDNLFDDLLMQYFSSWQLVKLRSVDMGAAYQLVYRGFLTKPNRGKAFLDAVRERNGNLPVSISAVAETNGTM